MLRVLPEGVEVRECFCGQWVAALGPWECERPTAEEAVKAVLEANTLPPESEASDGR